MIRMIEMNPFAIKTIPSPTDEMKLAALKKNGLLLQYIEAPTQEMGRDSSSQ